DQQTEVALSPMEGDIGGDAEVGGGQLEGVRIVHLHRPAQLKHLLETQRVADRCIAQYFRAGLNVDSLSLESHRIVAGNDGNHDASLRPGVALRWSERIVPVCWLQ